jgi:ERCC4-type nuclease
MITDPPKGRLVVKRDNHAINRLVPKTVVVVDTREGMPFTFQSFPNWIGGTVRGTLRTGDYTAQGMETLLCLERKSLEDLVGTLLHRRRQFLEECERMLQYPHRAILVEASYEEINSPYSGLLGEYSSAHPNGVSGSLDAVETRFNIPVIYTSSDRALSERKAASWLSKHFTYWWLETNGYGRYLQDGDL